MNGRTTTRRWLFSTALLCITMSSISTAQAFVPSSFAVSRGVVKGKDSRTKYFVSESRLSPAHYLCKDIVSSSSTKLQLAFDNDDKGAGIITTIAGFIIVVLFLGSSFFPMFEMSQRGRDTNDLSLADSVVSRQDAPTKLKGYETKFDALSRAAIQEKLNTIPVFYIVNSSNGSMGTNIYLSYADAIDSAAGSTVKATTMDQVMYPLILKRGRMRMATPPKEISKAEEALNQEDSNQKVYKLIASKSAKKDAKFYSVADGDVPLFIADRVAFASPKGPQVPLFLEKSDCVTSYERLRESGGNKLPAEPNIRTATVFDELNSMEKGTRPGVSQLAFYATVDDLLKASEIIQ